MGNCCIVKQWDHLYYDLAKVPHQDILYREGHVRGQYTMRRNSWRNRSSKTLRTSYGIAVTRETLQVGDKKGSILCVPWQAEDRLLELKMNVSVQEECLYVTWKQDGKMQELWLDVDNPKELVQLIQEKMEQAQGGCSLGRSDGSKSTRRNSLSSHSTRSSHTVSSHTASSSLSAKSSHHMIPEATIKSRRNSLSKSTHNKSSHTRSSHTRSSSRRNSSSTHSSKSSSTLTDKSRRRATM